MITRRFEQARWLLAEIGHRCDHWAVTRHPFCRRWIAGELTPDDLRMFADEHHHVASAVAVISRRAADLAEGLMHDELARLAADRDSDVELWCRFAVASGWDPGSAWYFGCDPLPETEAAEHYWVGGGERRLAEHLVTLYALETAQAEAARPQLNALLGVYGFPGDRSTRSFELRLLGEDGAAGTLASALTGALPVADPFGLLHHAERSFRAYWELLDGVERACASTHSAGVLGAEL